METPTITKKEAKRTLSGKKKKPEVIKHVLAKPFDTFWPCLNDEDNDKLKNVLEQCLPLVVPGKINIPYDKIKKIPKKDRKNFRNSFQNKVNLEPDRLELRFGINDVTVSLEKQEAASVLIANEVQPRLLVQHILDQAVLYDVPVLVVKNLKSICKQKCGLAAAAVALKKPELGSKLVQIQQTIYSLSQNYPVPENHVNFNRKLDLSAITIPDSENSGSVCVLSESESEKSEGETRNYHLMRVGGKRRAFIPPDSGPKVEAFITLDSTVDESLEIEDPELETTTFKAGNKSTKGMMKNIPKYRSLVVKKVKGDKNRNQRKMEKFKKKK